MTRATTDPPTRTSRRVMLGHTMRFLLHPGNSWVLAQRACRQAVGRPVQTRKSGSTINPNAVSQWHRDAEALDPSRFEHIEQHRRSTLQSYTSQFIHATDRRHPAEMSVSQRCQAVSLPHADGLCLYQLIRQYGFSRCVEIGGAFGVGTRYIAAALRDNGNGCVWSIEPDPVRHQIAGENLGDLAAHTRLVLGTSEQTFADLAAIKQDYDFFFIDAIHTYEATLSYFDQIRQLITKPCFCVFHDANSSWQMARVWSRISTHPAVTESASCGRLGFCLVNGPGG